MQNGVYKKTNGKVKEKVKEYDKECVRGGYNAL